MNIFIIHDIKRKSPYFEALYKTLNYSAINVIISSDLPPKIKLKERCIIHFHRLGRILNKYKNENNLIEIIKEYKKLGFEFAWTIHNFIPLEMSDKIEIEKFIVFLKDFSKSMDYIFTHTGMLYCK